MKKLIISLVLARGIIFSSVVLPLPPGALPQPEFEKKNFLLTADIPEMNVDFAIAWTDSAASLFVYPFDAVVLHVNVGGVMKDVFVISDAACNRLMMWVCSEPDGIGERDLTVIGTFYGAPGDFLRAPSGLATNAVNREFTPDEDVVYLADRGNDRILELRYQPDSLGGRSLTIEFSAQGISNGRWTWLSAHTGTKISATPTCILSSGGMQWTMVS